MRSSFTFPLMLALLPAQAQLINGSFEDGGSFSLSGWEWTCAQPLPVHDAPVGAGEWSVSKNMSSDNCRPSYLFQRIPFAQSGSHWHLSGWLRSDTVGAIAIPFIGFSSVSNGIFAQQNAIGSSGFDWSFVSINDTVHASASDTAVVLLNPSDAGGYFGAAWFDGIHLEPFIPLGVDEAILQLHTFLDEEQIFHVAAVDQVIRNAQLFDATGRCLATGFRHTAFNTVVVSAAALNVGVYIIRVSTDAGEMAVRFVKQ